MRGSVALTAYALSITPEAGFEWPKERREKLLDALKPSSTAASTDENEGPADMRLLRLAALAALARNGAATPAMIGQTAIPVGDMPTAILADWLVTLDKVPGVAAKRRSAAEAALRGRIVYEGTRLDLVDRNTAPWWMMIGGDEMALKALLAAIGRPGWAADAPRMMIGVSLRQQRGHWDTTPANAWGTVAVRRFEAAYPSAAVGTTTGRLLGQTLTGPGFGRARRQVAASGTDELPASGPPGLAPALAQRPAGALGDDIGARRGSAHRPRLRRLQGQPPGHLPRAQAAGPAQLGRRAQGADRGRGAGRPYLGGDRGSCPGRRLDRQRRRRAVRFAGRPGKRRRLAELYRARQRFLARLFRLAAQGRTTVEYVLRINGAGRFQLPPTRVGRCTPPKSTPPSPIGQWWSSRDGRTFNPSPVLTGEEGAQAEGLEVRVLRSRGTDPHLPPAPRAGPSSPAKAGEEFWPSPLLRRGGALPTPQPLAHAGQPRAWTRPPPLPGYEQTRSQWRASEAWLRGRDGRFFRPSDDFAVRRLGWVPLERIAPSLREAVVASEDRHFAAHGGVDWSAFAGSAWAALNGRQARGASTISMQVAGFLAPELGGPGARSFGAKLRQARAARALEAEWSKAEILEAYLNLASFRGETQGIGAPRTPCSPRPGRSGPRGFASAAALLPAPQAAPAAVARRACRLGRIADCSMMTALAQAMTGPGRRLADDPGLAPHLAYRLLRKPGETVATTIDPQAQALAAAALRRQLIGLGRERARDGAVIVVDNRTADVLAYVGGVGGASTAPAVDNANALRQAARP